MLAVVVTLKLVASAAALLCAYFTYGATVLFNDSKMDAGEITPSEAAERMSGHAVIWTVVAIIMIAGIWASA